MWIKRKNTRHTSTGKSGTASRHLWYHSVSSGTMAGRGKGKGICFLPYVLVPDNNDMGCVRERDWIKTSPSHVTNKLKDLHIIGVRSIHPQSSTDFPKPSPNSLPYTMSNLSTNFLFSMTFLSTVVTYFDRQRSNSKKLLRNHISY
ncbi:hypothetical protein J6590_090695 [Homalodisca vitripennis]|nr:hypothetical protein J6590_090695 [Homalodisca vitripennis]